MPSTCRWGILGTANIARKNWRAIRNSGNSTLTAVASRDAAKARKFIDECQADVPFPTAPVPCGYDELLARKDVDAVYIPLPTGIRREWVVKAAMAGKHVLCEKPCGVNAADVRAIGPAGSPERTPMLRHRATQPHAGRGFRRRPPRVRTALPLSRPGCVWPLTRLQARTVRAWHALEGSTWNGTGNCEVVQRREGLRLHLTD